MRNIGATLTVLLAAGACQKSEPSLLDAAVERAGTERSSAAGDSVLTLSVDFSVEDCPSFDPVSLSCTGTVPLSVRFIPLLTIPASSYVWDFGDGMIEPEASANHVYARPGTYEVLLTVRSSGAEASVRHAGFIVALPNPIGGPCESDAQCESGLTCICGSEAPCTAGPAHGICAKPCRAGICDDEGQVCAGLQTAQPPAARENPWQTSLCLRECAGDSECAAGTRCRILPPGPTGGAWVHGCFANLPADVGDPCMDSTGALRDDFCATGSCVDLGAKGVCSMVCGVASCPPGSDCAIFGDGRKLCLRPCTGGFACLEDGLLTCVIPGSGDLGYYLVNSASAASSYCAPIPCVVSEECGPKGTCVATTGNGHCVRRPD